MEVGKTISNLMIKGHENSPHKNLTLAADVIKTVRNTRHNLLFNKQHFQYTDAKYDPMLF